MTNTPKPNQAIITSRYWLVLSIVSGVVALLPLAVVLVNFAANPSSNPFDESGYGAALGGAAPLLQATETERQDPPGAGEGPERPVGRQYPAVERHGDHG